MDCLMAQKLIKPYVEDQLEDRVLSDFLDHVESCGNCYDQLQVYYAIYHTLKNNDDDCDYNFKKKLSHALALSRMGLQRRRSMRLLEAVTILLAEGVLLLTLFFIAPAGRYRLMIPRHLHAETEGEENAGNHLETEGLWEDVLENGAVTGKADSTQSTDAPMELFGNVVSGEVAEEAETEPLTESAGAFAQAGEAGAVLWKEP